MDNQINTVMENDVNMYLTLNGISSHGWMCSEDVSVNVVGNDLEDMYAELKEQFKQALIEYFVNQKEIEND